MKQIFKIIIILIIVSMIIFMGCMSKSEGTVWEVVKTFKSLTNVVDNKDITSAAQNNENTNFQIGFLNDKIGFAMNKGNHVYYSNDGGEKWDETVVDTQPCLSGMELIDENNIVIGCECSYVEYSNDKGKTWNKTEESSYPMLNFYNKNSGMIAKANNVIKIMENFKTVNEITLPEEFKNTFIINLSCISVNEAYILFYGKGPLLKTIDGGKNWEKIHFSGLKNKSLFQSSNTTKMRFTDINNGIIVTYDNKNKAWISLMTNDGGKSWKYSKLLNTEKGLRSYISKDGNYLTIINENKDENPIMLLKRKI